MNASLEEAKKLLMFGDVEIAETMLKKILKTDPKNSEVLHGLGLISFRQKKFERGIEYLNKAILVDKNNPELYSSLGVLQSTQGFLEKAALSFEKAKSLYEKEDSPSNSAKLIQILLKLADIYLKEMRFLEAKPVLKMILRKEPQNLFALKLLSQLYLTLLQYHHSILTLEQMPIDRAIREALKVEVYLLKRDHRNAFISARKALELDPENPDYYCLLGDCYMKTEEFEKSIQAYEKGLKLDPFHAKMLGRLLTLQLRVCEWASRGSVIKQLRILCALDGAENFLNEIPPTTAILAGYTNQELQKVAEAHCKKINEAMKPVRESNQFTFSKKQNRRLKIGYLSSDFHNHATAHLMLDLFGLHDRKKFEIYAYSFGKTDRSLQRKRIEEDCDHFIDIMKISDLKAAQQINRDRIDILVDLKGHIVDHRMGISALRPSPVQVHYLGYPGTIGAPFIDYIIADRFLIPKEERKFYSESVVFMPYTYQVNTESKAIQKKIPSKEEYGIPEGKFVFCCFNQNAKFDVETLSAWMKILKNVPESILWVWGNYENLKKKLDAFGKEYGIHPKRLIVAPTQHNAKHLARMQLADIFLDTFLYNAHTSCSDALRVGLPVLTCVGRTFASRVAGSLLHLLKVDELLAKNPEEYIEKAVDFAHHPEKLHKLKMKIKKKQEVSHLYDSKLFTRDMEAAYIEMWDLHQAGHAPKDIIIKKT